MIRMYLFFALLFSFIFLCCDSKQTVQNTLQSHYGKQITFNLPIQYVYEYTTLDLIGQPQLAPIKVVVYISSELCSPCFANYLSATTKFIKKFSSDSVQYICIMESRPIEEIQEAMNSLELP